MTDFRIPDQTHIGQVHLQTQNLPRLAQFYTGLLGFKEIQTKGKTLYLSANGDFPALIVVSENPNLLPHNRYSPGLFHTAFLLPNRSSLAQLLKQLMEHGIRLGFGDHAVSEAIYLSDPDGNGVEVYADRPRNMWPIVGGQVQMTTEPVDTAGLLNELKHTSLSWQGIHEQTTIGHIHLQVSSVAKAEQFYHQILGFAVTQRTYPGALFVSAGGYHHHLGLNIWNSHHATPTLTDSIGLHSFTIHVPGKEILEAISGRLTQSGIKSTLITDTTLHCQDYDGIQLFISVQAESHAAIDV